MPRNMSFFLTTEQYRNKIKFITRRLGWWFAKPGDIQNGVEKGQGLKKGEKVVKLGQHRIISTRPEPLRRMTDDPEYGAKEVILEGFPDMTPQEFVDTFCKHNKCTPDKTVNRIEIEYV